MPSVNSTTSLRSKPELAYSEGCILPVAGVPGMLPARWSGEAKCSQCFPKWETAESGTTAVVPSLLCTQVSWEGVGGWGPGPHFPLEHTRARQEVEGGGVEPSLIPSEW